METKTLSWMCLNWKTVLVKNARGIEVMCFSEDSFGNTARPETEVLNTLNLGNARFIHFLRADRAREREKGEKVSYV